MSATTIHVWHDPFLTRCIVVLAHLLEGYPMPTHAEIVATCVKRHGPKPIFYRSIEGEWCELMHRRGSFVVSAPVPNAHTAKKLRTDFPMR